jgi:hypothetical protein
MRIITLVFTVAFLSIMGVVFSKESDLQNVYSQTISENVIKIITNKNYQINKMYLDGNLSPIGWSKDGYFAYAEYAIETLRENQNEIQCTIKSMSTVYIMNTIKNNK